MSGQQAAQQYPGQRLGLPEDGPGSVASWLRRFVALFIDWIAARLVVTLFVGSAAWQGNGIEQIYVFVVFVVEATVLTTLLGGSFGQLVMRVAVARLDRRQVTIPQALVRSLLICLVIPPLVFNRDNRGLHDMAVGTVTLTR